MEHRFIKGKDIVLFSFQAWESEIGFNFKDMAFELARFNRVLFINRADDRVSLMPHKNGNGLSNNKKAEQLIKVQDNFWVYDTGLIMESINWIKWSGLYDVFNKANNKRIAQKINHAIEELSFKDVILINDNDFFRGLHLKKLIPSCSKYIFYIRDFLTIQPYFKKHGVRLEQKLIKSSDLIVANSAYLANYARKWNNKSYDIGQGCDFEGYLADDLPVPEDLENIPRPIIGYCGAITAMRLDESIVEHIAESFPQCSIVLVGPEDAHFEKSKLKDHKNIYFLGGKAPKSVPQYIFHFDICINPQLTNPLTIGNYPRKIDEYLAMGKPVVATSTDGMVMFKEHVYLCESKEDYAKMINLILSDKTAFSEAEKKRRINFALSHTWEESIGLLGDAYYDAGVKN
ncbi:MAG TPA: glycosyltransferase [Puia sp.]|nr:glycosyltransferase [Puia sp.]